MSPSSREKEYARRRYEKWQERRQAKATRQAMLRRRAMLAVGAVVGTLAVVGAVLVFARGWDGTSTVTASPSGGGEPSSGTSAGASPGASADDAAAGCAPVPTTQPSPAGFDGPPPASLAEDRNWTLTLDTTCGPLTITLDGAKAPQAVSNMLFLARQGFFDGTRCHRLTTAGIYVLQCGDPEGTGAGGPGYDFGPIENAPADDVYPAGTVAMARQDGRGDSMGSQFFLVYRDSTIPSDDAGGYSVFGTIAGGLDVVEKVAAGGVEGGGTDGPPARAVAILGSTVG